MAATFLLSKQLLWGGHDAAIIDYVIDLKGLRAVKGQLILPSFKALEQWYHQNHCRMRWDPRKERFYLVADGDSDKQSGHKRRGHIRRRHW